MLFFKIKSNLIFSHQQLVLVCEASWEIFIFFICCYCFFFYSCLSSCVSKCPPNDGEQHGDELMKKGSELDPLLQQVWSTWLNTSNPTFLISTTLS